MTETSDLHCRTLALELDVSPIGTAGSYDTFVFVEAPPPWPSDIERIPHFGALAERLRQLTGRTKLAIRLQAMAAGNDRGPERRVIVHRVHEDRPGVFERFEALVDGDDLADQAMRVVQQALAAPSGGGDTGRPQVLLCTHGGRDVCCGRNGTALWQEMRDAVPGVEFLRTSHSGGHRFAPTAMTFPAGQLWAWLDREVLTGIVGRTGDPRELVGRHYRGAAAMPSPAVQVLEREAFAREGWAWLDHRRVGYEVGTAERDVVRARIDFEAPGGDAGSYQAQIGNGRRVPVPKCRQPLGAAVKSQTELEIVSLTRT
jgi:hypothetical protein